MKGHLAILGVDGERNSAGKTFHAEGVTFLPEVPVYLVADTPAERDFAHIVGKAKLSVHNGVLWADCEFVAHRLPASMLDILYPHPCNIIGLMNGDSVKRVKIDGVNLSCDLPLDSRIRSLSNQGMKAEVKG
jgi:hypothetical protein